MNRGGYRTSNFGYDTLVTRKDLYFAVFRRGFFNQPKVSPCNDGSSKSSANHGNSFVIPGATVATLLMLGVLHIRRMYDDKKIEEARIKGVELDFHPDVKAGFLRLLPLRSISRFWGDLTGMEIPLSLRPHLYKAWGRAFHSDIQESQLPLEEYKSLREFFVRRLKEGLRPVDPDPHCLVSPVDGIILRFGELDEPGDMIEQVKGYSYSASSLLGTNSYLPNAARDANEDRAVGSSSPTDASRQSWWTVSFASPKVRSTSSSRSMKGLFYCVIYLRVGDYHRIHSPVDWNILLRRHFSGNLFPLNERATRTIRSLYVENERVVLEGRWKEGYMAMAAIGAATIGSIELSVGPALKTNKPQKKMLQSQPLEECFYEPQGTGLLCRKGDEVGAFNLGSTVVLIFQAPTTTTEPSVDGSSFKFCVKKGDKIRVGQALGRWSE